MTQEEAAALLQSWKTVPATGTATNAAPAILSPQPRWQNNPETSMQYWSRSPIVERAPGFVRSGAELVGQGAGDVVDAMQLPARVAWNAPIQAGRYVTDTPVGQSVIRGAGAVGNEMGRDIRAGWNAFAAPIRYVGGELNRTIVQPVAELGGALAEDVGRGARVVGDAVSRGVGAVAGAAGRGVASGARWARENVIPPPIATPQSRQEYDMLRPGTLYIDPQTGKTYRKQ